MRRIARKQNMAGSRDSMTQGRILLHVDMDSFFASVEVREDPELSGKPVVIGADPQGGRGRGVVSTCSYEARKLGIHSAMPISTAYRLCPGAVFLPVRYPLYRECSGRIMEILRSHSEKFSQVSIDEAYLDLSSAGRYETAAERAGAIKQEIRESEGLTCSVGIASGKILAKIASDYRKPDGITVIRPQNAAAFLSGLPVGKIPGIGKKTGDYLRSIGIATIGHLAACDVQELIARFGKWGIAMHQLANGIDQTEITPGRGIRSIGREITFGEDTGDPVVLATSFDALIADVHRRLTAHELRCRTVTVKIRFSGFVTRTRSQSLPHCTDDPCAIGTAARNLFVEMAGGATIRLIGIRLSHFDERGACQRRLDDFGPL
jgi:DNA polymerase IV (DinB-like DNA polymerase)